MKLGSPLRQFVNLVAQNQSLVRMRSSLSSMRPISESVVTGRIRAVRKRFRFVEQAR